MANRAEALTRTELSFGLFGLPLSAALFSLLLILATLVDPAPGQSDPLKDPSEEERTLRVYWYWRASHPSMVLRYGEPQELRFVDTHDQFFGLGHIVYDVTDGRAIVFLSTPGSKLRRLPADADMTPGSGRVVNESVFAEVTKGLASDETQHYRRFINARVTSPDFKGIGIIGSISTLYIRHRLLPQLGPPADYERPVRALYGRGKQYEFLVALRHSPFAGTEETSWRSVYILFPDDTYERQVARPTTLSPTDTTAFQALYAAVKSGIYRPPGFLERLSAAYRKSPWLWVVTPVGGFLGAYLAGLGALALLAWRRGTVFFSRSWLFALATKPLLFTPFVARPLLFLGYERRLAHLPALEKCAQSYFGLLARDPVEMLIPPDTTGSVLHDRIAHTIDRQRPVLIVGRGGAGKSTILARFALLALRDQLPAPLSGFRPVLIPADFYVTSLVQAIAEILRNRDGVAADENTVTTQLESGRFLVLFDGLSEVEASKRADLLRSASSTTVARSRFLISTRPYEGLPSEIPAFKLEPLTSRAVEELLPAFKLSQRREQHVRRQLHSFSPAAISPLLLTMAIEQSTDEETSPTRGELYESYFRHLLRIQLHDPAWDGWRSVLELVARWFLLEGGRRGIGLPHERLLDLLTGQDELSGEKNAFQRLVDYYNVLVSKPHDLLDRLDGAGLLERSRRRWRFTHDTFEEYFAASHMVACLEEERVLPWLERWKTSDKAADFLDVLDFVREMASPSAIERLLREDLPVAWKTQLAPRGLPS